MKKRRYKLLLVEEGAPDAILARWNLTFEGLDETVKADDLNAPDPSEVLETLQMVVSGERDELIVSYDIKAALSELAQFKRSVGQSNEDRDVLSVQIGMRLRRWTAELNAKGSLSPRNLADLTDTLKRARAMGVDNG